MKQPKKKIIAALALLFFGVLFVAYFSRHPGVYAINWDRFEPIEVTDQESLFSKTTLLANTALTYVLTNEIDTLQRDDKGRYLFGGIAENNIRPPAQTVMALGLLRATDSLNTDAVGKSHDDIRAIHGNLIDSLTRNHVANGGEWGECWQCAHWAFFTGFGAWLVWDELPEYVQENIQNMVVFEANRFYGEPQYCNDCTDDSKAEENAWNANVIALAAAMMPYHEQQKVWKEKSSQFMLAAFAKQSDTESKKKIDGKRLRDWLSGWNIREEGYLYNHDRVHPDYMASAAMNLWNPILFFLADKNTPEAAVWNVDLVYDSLEHHDWSSPPYDAPGGTMYQKGSALVYYPQGTDWSDQLIDNVFLLDVLVDVFGIEKDGDSPSAKTWAHLRASHLLHMQDRTSTGQLYLPEDKVHFYPKESKAAAWFAMAHVATWLEQQKGWGRAVAP